VGNKGGSDDDALAATINGLYKVELIHRRAHWQAHEAVELATPEWVSWFNHHRLFEPSALYRRRKLRQTMTATEQSSHPAPGSHEPAATKAGAIQVRAMRELCLTYVRLLCLKVCCRPV
jgi:hypothetical protein